MNKSGKIVKYDPFFMNVVFGYNKSELLGKVTITM